MLSAVVADAWPRVGNLQYCTPHRSVSYRINNSSPWPVSYTTLQGYLTTASNFLTNNYKDYLNVSWVPSSVPLDNSGQVPTEMMDLGPASGQLRCTTGGDPYVMYIAPSIFGSPSNRIVAMISHEMLHSHGLSHDGTNNNLMGPAPGTAAEQYRPVISTCGASFDQYPYGTAQDSSQAAYRMTGNGPGAMLSANIGFEQTTSLPYSFWNSYPAGAADLQTWAPYNGSRYARVLGYNQYVYQAVTLSGHNPNFQLSYAYRGSTPGYVGWEVWQQYVDYPSYSSGCGSAGTWANGWAMNQAAFSGWFLAAGSGGGSPYYNGNGTDWWGYGINPIGLPAPAGKEGSALLVRIYNQLNGGHLNVDNVTLWQV
jgi:hypothetical protein